jgi:hypothetical protein
MKDLQLLEHSWTAEVLLKNGKQISIWYTAWHSSKDSIEKILSVSSDYPKNFVNRNLI